MKPIRQFQVIHHGIECSQYFQGCGVSHTKFEEVATGVGDTPLEAIDDALESLAQNGWDVSSIEASDDYRKAKLSVTSASDEIRQLVIGENPQNEGESNDDYDERLEDLFEEANTGMDTYYYLSIRVSSNPEDMGSR